MGRGEEVGGVEVGLAGSQDVGRALRPSPAAIWPEQPWTLMRL